MRKPKLGFLTERMLLGFGVDLVIHKTAEGLAALGYEVTVFPSVSDGTFENDRYQIIPLGIPASRIFPYFEWNALKKLRWLRTQDIDLFLIETFPFFALGPFLRKPFVVVDHGVSSTSGCPLWLKADFLCMRLTQHYVYFPLATRVVAISRFIRDRLPLFLRRRARVIYSGSDHYSTDREIGAGRVTIRRKFGIEDDEVLLLYVGRINPRLQPYKGTARLIDCVQRLKSRGHRVQLLMVGFGSKEDEAWLSAQGVRCWMSAPAEEMPSIYAASDIYVTASEWEGFDLPLAEAQRFGKPAVALNIGAHAEVVRNGETAYLVDGLEELEEATRSLVLDRDLRRRMGEMATKSAERFSWSGAIAEYDRLIREIGQERWTR